MTWPLRSRFSIFGYGWKSGKGEPLIPRFNASLDHLHCHCARLAKALGLVLGQVDSAWLQLCAAARFLAAAVASSRSFDSVDNRDMWALVLEPQWWTGARADDEASVATGIALGQELAVPREIGLMVRFYITVTDGTGRPGAQDWHHRLGCHQACEMH